MESWLDQLHDPVMLVDKTNFGLVLYNHANFYRFEKTSSCWLVKRISVFLCISLVNQCHTSGITVYNRTLTNIENIVRAVHSCNSWFLYLLHVQVGNRIMGWVGMGYITNK